MFPFFIRKPLGLFQCCIGSNSDIGCTKISRDSIGSPTDFKHILHLNADDANSAEILEYMNGTSCSTIQSNARPITIN